MKTEYTYIVKEEKMQDGRLLWTANRKAFTSFKKAYEYMEFIRVTLNGTKIENKHNLKLYDMVIYEEDHFTYHITIQRLINE